MRQKKAFNALVCLLCKFIMLVTRAAEKTDVFLPVRYLVESVLNIFNSISEISSSLRQLSSCFSRRTNKLWASKLADVLSLHALLHCFRLGPISGTLFIQTPSFHGGRAYYSLSDVTQSLGLFGDYLHIFCSSAGIISQPTSLL